jgi:hypothetical protein
MPSAQQRGAVPATNTVPVMPTTNETSTVSDRNEAGGVHSSGADDAQHSWAENMGSRPDMQDGLAMLDRHQLVAIVQMLRRHRRPRQLPQRNRQRRPFRRLT